jgi:hypothetical protein
MMTYPVFVSFPCEHAASMQLLYFCFAMLCCFTNCQHPSFALDFLNSWISFFSEISFIVGIHDLWLLIAVVNTEIKPNSYPVSSAWVQNEKHLLLAFTIHL